SALSWFSPIAWAQQMRPFVDLRWWPLALLVVVAIGLMALATAPKTIAAPVMPRHIAALSTSPNPADAMASVIVTVSTALTP
ncbi:hypothetical protein, partial [Mycolicibacterium moriokaense]|uniref:hypothetical protein n=1 Tax=Mycolicibacterium moriokaense TaxID=39691 RepID=UPI0010560EE6